MSDRTPAEVVAEVLRAEGCEPGNSIHSWRCEYPDRYGPCTCVEDTAAEVVAALGLVEEYAACKDDETLRMDGRARQRFVQPTLQRAREAVDILFTRRQGTARNPSVEVRWVTPWQEVDS